FCKNCAVTLMHPCVPRVGCPCDRSDWSRPLRDCLNFSSDVPVAEQRGPSPTFGDVSTEHVRKGLSHQAAAELSREFFRDCAAGETPQQVIAVIFVSVPDVRHLDAALVVCRASSSEVQY